MIKNNFSNISTDVVIDDNVEVGTNVVIKGKGCIKKNAVIGNGVIIDGDFSIGENSIIDDYTIIRGNVDIGSDNWIYPFCTIGTGPQHLKFPETHSNHFLENNGSITIGSNNIIREYTTIHHPTIEKSTILDSHCYVMAYCHIAHDCKVSNNVIMANQTTLGGHVEIEKFANIGLNVSIHQFSRIGEFAMVGMGSTIVKDVLPYSLVIDKKFSRINKIGLERNNISGNDVSEIEKCYHNFEQISNLEKNHYVEKIQAFIHQSKRGFYPPQLNQ